MNDPMQRLEIPRRLPRLARSALPALALLGVFLSLVIPTAHGQSATVSGITEPVVDSTMAFPATGIVAKRHFEEGASVKKGDILVELDKQLEELDVARRRQAMQLAKTELERLETLAQKNTISVSREEIDKKRAEFEVAKIELELSQEMVRRRQLVAPVDGHIATYFKQVGEACDQERAPVVRVVDTSRCLFVADCDAAAWQRLKMGETVKLEFEDRQGPLRIDGKVHYIAPVIEPASGLLRVKILFENPSLRIRPGVAGRLILE
ncbi:MAG: efflux RND transporter periplasmic adaptor subunit [Verrucomicrobiales bacterium]|nr:efflux RND transporter periplasmic adaptor subunit [Verrucomicrobiales bacterium]